MLKLGACLLLTINVAAVSQDTPAPSRFERAVAPSRIRVSSAVLGGFLDHGVTPLYPEEAIRAGIKGDVILVVQTDETGHIVRSLAVEGDPLLTAASIEALQGFRFRPYLLSGNPVSVESQIAFRFTLKDKARGKAEYTFDVPYRPEFRTGAVTKDGVLVLSPRKVSGPDPTRLPELAGKSGSVYLTVTVGDDGKVEDVKVVGGDESLAGPVVAAVKQAVYEPMLVDGKASTAKIQESYHLGGSRD